MMIGPDYELRQIVGEGGMSTVWLADDRRANREVAIKVLRPEFSDNQEFLSRFRNEAQTAERIQHPNVVATYDYRELVDDRGRNFCYIVMEFVRGESLADLLARERRVPEQRALNILEQAAHGLATIHAMHLVHRDIKPGNIMITPDDRVKITDFGIAKAAAAVPLTRTGMVVGTAQYVSPEQAQGHSVTAASDVYSLGVVGYELLSGKRPFTGDSSVSIAISHIRDAAPPLDGSISAPARELISIAMRKDAARRFADGRSFAEAISRARLGQFPVDPAPAPATEHFAPPTTVLPVGTPAEVLQEAKKKDSGGWIATIILAAVVAAGAGTWYYLASSPEPEPVIVTTEVPTTTTSQEQAPPRTPTQRQTQLPPRVVTQTPTEEPTQQTTRRPTPQPTSTSVASVTPEATVSSEPATPELQIPDLGVLLNNG